ncbi:hypothetical protein ACIBMZ_26525 [Micromonospora sp. NPDC049900]|uniref:hypothetical protein n=1 Tax=Micromonospora sp. NPDC049900 TaxID=3364275 RepID=UPI0037B30820
MPFAPDPHARGSGVPDGVALPPDLVEADARLLVDALAAHFGWTYTIWDRADAVTALREQQLDEDDDLSDAEWTRAARTPTWAALAPLARHVVQDRDLIGDTLP